MTQVLEGRREHLRPKDDPTCVFCGNSPAFEDDSNELCLTDEDKVAHMLLTAEERHQAEEAVDLFRMELQRYETYLRENCSISIRDNQFCDSRDEITESVTESSMDALIDWVKAGRISAASHGAIFDTGFRAVSEGGEILYFDPEVIVDEVEFLRLAWKTLQHVNVPAERLKPLMERYDKLYGSVLSLDSKEKS